MKRVEVNCGDFIVIGDYTKGSVTDPMDNEELNVDTVLTPKGEDITGIFDRLEVWDKVYDITLKKLKGVK